MLKDEWKNVGRNDLCPCGSGSKYKKCCLKKERRAPIDYKRYYKQKYDINLKGPEEIEKIRKAGKLVVKGLDRAAAMLAPGVTTNAINDLVADIAAENGAVCAPLNYRGFPKSVCTSVNDVICHGIPDQYALKDGDIINVDITYILDGYYADASKTYFVGTPSQEAKRIVEVTASSLLAAMEMLKPGNSIGDIGWAIQNHAESRGCSVVREFVGHGLGTMFHEPPQVPHYGTKGQGITLVPGMVFTVEPMINLGRPELYIADDNWTAITRDRSLSAQFEQTFLITDDGYESLTPYDLQTFIG
jgi:methionyl aminopeptidase